MPRNLDHRLEVVVPVGHAGPAASERDVDALLSDNTNSWSCTGTALAPRQGEEDDRRVSARAADEERGRARPPNGLTTNLSEPMPTCPLIKMGD
jgi:polyphosphate kinase